MSYDLFHTFGQDLALSASGNLATANGAVLASQTVARYILTNPGDDPYDLTFGLGARQFIGEPNAAAKVKASITQGLTTLSVVDQTQPTSVTTFYDDEYTLMATVVYTDADTGSTVSLSVPME